MWTMVSVLRLLAAAAALGLWLALFFLGRTAGGAIHLLPAAALALVVWRIPNPLTRQPKENSR